MQSSRVTGKVRCDMGGCKNLADYSFRGNDNARLNINLCENCLNEIYNAAGKLLVPKNIENILVKRIKEKESR